MKLSHRITATGDALPPDHPLMRWIESVIGWQVEPTFATSGRTAWMTPPEPVSVKTAQGPVTIEAIKLKGVGLLDHTGQIRPPGVAPFTRVAEHHAIGPDGRFDVVGSRPAPTGGCTESRALVEHEVASTLLDAGAPCQVPLMVATYTRPDLRFPAGGEPLAVVASGQPHARFTRADIALAPAYGDPARIAEFEHLARCFGVADASHPTAALLEIVYAQYGHALRRFAEAGYYRHNGHCSNFGCSAALRSIYLTDLDSTQRIDGCTAVQGALQVVRDVASAAFYLLYTLTNPDHIELFPVEQTARFDLFGALLAGYYADVPEHLRAHAVDVLDERWRETRDQVLARPARPARPEPSADVDYQTFFLARWGDRWLPMRETYGWLFAVLAPLHRASALGRERPLVDDRALHALIADHAGHDVSRRIAHRIGSSAR